jgi:hypothetical protein
MKTIFTFLILLLSCELTAAEADHYTFKDLPLRDESIKINAMANEALDIATLKLNNTGSCNNSRSSEKELYEELTKHFSNHTKGKLVIDILHGDDIAKRTIPLKESVYGTWSIFNGYLLGKKSAADSPLALTAMIRIGEQVIGVDKLEHMFGMGQIYFKSHYLKGRKLRRVLKSGIAKEKTFLGGNILATGVFAYADLAANFNGMRFWNNVLQKRDDILGKSSNLGPYIRCESGKWSIDKENKIDFKNYVDDSMDESINCSKFASTKGLKKYKSRMTKLDSNFSCPMSKDRLDKMLYKYRLLTPKDGKKRSLSHWIINKNGLGKVSYFNEF